MRIAALKSKNLDSQKQWTVFYKNHEQVNEQWNRGTHINTSKTRNKLVVIYRYNCSLEVIQNMGLQTLEDTNRITRWRKAKNDRQDNDQ